MPKLKHYFILIIIFFAVIFSNSRFFKRSVQKYIQNKSPGLTSQSLKQTDQTIWKFQCVDTMKTSRDSARSWENRPDLLDLIDGEMERIRDLGANCVAINTPYDEEFLPYLAKWVNAARQKNLIIWYRGNFSGWEGWFEYPKFTDPAEHHGKLAEFIVSNHELFRDGDLFTPAPEPENGMLGDPRSEDDIKEKYLRFLTDSYKICSDSFENIEAKVSCGYFSTNADVSKKILDRQIVSRLGERSVIDHYVADPKELGEDIRYLYENHGGMIVVGEFGAPIPDINGDMTEGEQAEFVGELLRELYINKDIIEGVNYWVLTGGTTALYNEDGSPRKAVEVVKDYYRPGAIAGSVADIIGDPLEGAEIKIRQSPAVKTNSQGKFYTAVPAGETEIEVEYPGHKKFSRTITVSRKEEVIQNIILEPVDTNWMEKLLIEIRRVLKSLKG